MCTDDFVASQIQRVQDDFDAARKLMQRQATCLAFCYGPRVKPAAFWYGEWVWYFYPQQRAGL